MSVRKWDAQRVREALVGSTLGMTLAVASYAYFALWACGVKDSQSTVTTLVSVGATGLGISTALLVGNGVDEPKQKAAALWLEHNRFQLAEDLARGSGPTLSELAGLSKGHHAIFGALLREHRPEFAELIGELHPSGPRALAFFTRVGELLASSPELAGEFELAKKRSGGG